MRLFTIKVNGRTYQTTDKKDANNFALMWGIGRIKWESSKTKTKLYKL